MFLSPWLVFTAAESCFRAIGECIGFLPPQSCPRVYWQAGFMTQVSHPLRLNSRASVRSRSKKHGECVGRGGLLPQLVPARVLRAHFWQLLVRTVQPVFYCSLALVYGTVFKVQDFNTYVVYLGVGLVVWNGISSAIGSAPNLFEHNHSQVHNTNLNPIFYVLEEWAFQLQTFLQSFALVLLALSCFQHDLLLNLLFYGWLPLLNLFLFLFWVPMIVCLLGARYRDFYQLRRRFCSWCSFFLQFFIAKTTSARWLGRLISIPCIGFLVLCVTP